MRRLLLPALFLVLLGSGSTPALAAYKCESGGQVSYSDKPCPGGKAINLPAEDKAAAIDAQQRATRDRNELIRLENERRLEEASIRKERLKVAKSDAAHRKKCQSLAMHKKWSEEDASAASLKSAEKARTKARRKAERYALECG